MNRIVKILLIVLVGIALIEAFLVFPDKFPGTLHDCHYLTMKADKSSVGCTSYYGSPEFGGYLLALTINNIKKEADDVYLTVNFPLLFGFTAPMRLRAGTMTANVKGDQRTPICFIVGKEFESSHSCQLVTLDTLATTLKPNKFIVAEFFTQDQVHRKDPSYRCQDGQAKFVKVVQGSESFLAFLPYFGRAPCVPTIGQIFYK